MRHSLSLSAVLLAAALVGAPSSAPAQMPEPAAGNPAINSTPQPGATASPMASPSSELQIPKGSNPDSGSGNMAAGSGATPSTQSLESGSPNAMPQTANNPDAGSGASQPDSAGQTDPMPQGKYASPPANN